MAEDKFAKKIGDAELNEVAGGTKKEMQKDIAFLKEIGSHIASNATETQAREAWAEYGIGLKYDAKNPNDYMHYESFDDDGYEQTRQNAMIMAMRKAGKVVDLDKYL